MKEKSKLKNNKLIPVSEPLITLDDANSVFKTVKSGWISSFGSEIEKFENNFAKFLGLKYATTVSNGTAALELALKAIGIKKNDEVIIPNFTIISNALAVIKLGAIPIFVDCDLYDWNMNIDEVEKKINLKTRAVIATHIYNFALDIKRLEKICKKKKIYLVEDAAEVVGLDFEGKKCGSFGDVSTFSFYANKQITTGEGGMIASNNKKIINRCKSFKNLCFGKKLRFRHDDIGWNYRFTNLQAALGNSQLKRISKIVKLKKAIGTNYYKLLNKYDRIYIPPPKINKKVNIYWVVGIVIKDKYMTSEILSQKLLKFGIQTRPFFYPMNKQPILKKYKQDKKTKFENSNYISKYGIYLPSGIGISKKKINFICNKLKLVLGNGK
jgi:perosamine synthetase